MPESALTTCPACGDDSLAPAIQRGVDRLHGTPQRQDLLQVIDEPVEIEDVLRDAREAGLLLSRYEAFDIDASGPQYQLLLLSTLPALAASPKRRKELGIRRRVTTNPLARVLRRTRLSIRLLRRGMPRAALWLVAGKGRPPRSLVRESANRRHPLLSRMARATHGSP